MTPDRLKSVLENGKSGVESNVTEFSRIRDLFQDLGLLGERLHIEHEGNRYRVSCDEKTFMVYRVNDGGGAKYGMPGWPVCVVTPESTFEECSTPNIGDDHCSCRVGVSNWLDIIGDFCRRAG